MDEEGGQVKALHLEADGSKEGRPKKRWKEVLECDMIARGLQRLNAQDRERWRPVCENRMTPTCTSCREHLLGSRNRKYILLEQNDNGDCNLCVNNLRIRHVASIN